MTVRVRDLLKLNIMKDFKVVAGASGLDKTISTTEILDFEFLEEGEEYRGKSFEGDSIVLTSLLFAKDHPEQVTEAVKKLYQFNVHCLAYKPVIFKKLPAEALSYADKVGLVIMEFGNDEFFEDVIFGVKALTRKTMELEQIEPEIEKMLRVNMDQEELVALTESMNPSFRTLVRVYCIKGDETPEEMAMKIRFTNLPEKLRRQVFICRCRGRYLVILTGDTADEKIYEEMLDSVFTFYCARREILTIGESSIGRLSDGLNRYVIEAYWSEAVAEIENCSVRKYPELGIYKLFIPRPGAEPIDEYMKNYLAPLMEDDDTDKVKDAELFDTAVQYVLAKGDMNAAAERMFCHKNTVRYRVGKLQEKLDPESGDKVFFQDLSAAVIILLLKKFNK
ncbi:PucR family transcriptional regulator [Aminicella lysinilytica]|uniref:CdaR family transcriptional regulator n=1 Tax=Aminicella lysinilytica TaxID=433323 RepID=A0A4R6Q9W9_9FIRM|nr:PucR family transcriptional regulator [Aminicella lysinilytica]TDP58995.1 CdaR family transcriptional regulator [Aminicella lysinilytica]